MSRCARCKAKVERAATGRPRSYCSAACRQAVHRKRRRQSVHFSSATVEWSTPQDLLHELDAELGPFDLDPCATADNAACERFYTKADDGLVQRWSGRVFMNPPYGRSIGAWMRKAWESSQTTADVVVCLVPARVDTAWWHDYATRGEVRFLRGRLKFGQAEASAPFPSAVIVFRNASSRNETLGIEPVREAA